MVTLPKNVCGVERIARALGGLVLIAIALGLNRRSTDERISLGQLLVLYAGMDLVVTAIGQFCLTNYVLGINTCEASLDQEIRRIITQ